MRRAVEKMESVLGGQRHLLALAELQLGKAQVERKRYAAQRGDLLAKLEAFLEKVRRERLDKEAPGSKNHDVYVIILTRRFLIRYFDVVLDALGVSSHEKRQGLDTRRTQHPRHIVDFERGLSRRAGARLEAYVVSAIHGSEPLAIGVRWIYRAYPGRSRGEPDEAELLSGERLMILREMKDLTHAAYKHGLNLMKRLRYILEIFCDSLVVEDAPRVPPRVPPRIPEGAGVGRSLLWSVVLAILGVYRERLDIEGEGADVAWKRLALGEFSHELFARAFYFVDHHTRYGFAFLPPKVVRDYVPDTPSSGPSPRGTGDRLEDLARRLTATFATIDPSDRSAIYRRALSFHRHSV